MDEFSKVKLSVLIEEYKTLREEAITALKLQQAVVRYSLATIGVLVAVSFSIWDKSYSQYVFFVLIPLCCYFGLTVWMGEVGRMMRAGNRVAVVESKVNILFQGESVLSWETDLRSASDGKTIQLEWNYFAIILLHLGISVASVWIGLSKTWSDHSSDALLAIALTEAAVLIIVVLVHFLQGLRFKRL